MSNTSHHLAGWGIGLLLCSCTGRSPDPTEVSAPPEEASTVPSSGGTSPGQSSSSVSDSEPDAAIPVVNGPKPAQCGNAPAEVLTGDAQLLFDHPKVPHFDLFLPPEEWEALKQNAQDEQYVAAQACFEGGFVGTVGLRFKGYYGSLFGCFDEQGEQTCPRLSMKVKFNEYYDEQRLFGLKRLNFNAYRHDDSRIKEKLVYELYRSMGIVTPRSAWAVLRVNGESLGIFGMVEQIDGRFTKDRWPETPDGNLYKEVWPTETDPEEVRAALETNEESGDVQPFVDFSTALVSASDEERSARLAQFMDVDYLARYMAVDDAVANYDGVTYFWTDGVTSDNHNFYIYENAANHYTLVPWDVEASFWINPDHAAPHWTVLPEDCSLTYPYWEGEASAAGCDPLFRALHAHIPQWREASRELLDGPFSEQAMLDNIDRYAAFIADEAHADPTPNMYTSFDNAVAELRATVGDLRERLEVLIAE